MQPQKDNTPDPYKPKWRHFHPADTVWVFNPLTHDVKYNCTDELGVKYEYIIPAQQKSRLPGGLIATLGLKHIIDELIQANPVDAAMLYDTPTRTRYESDVIRRVKSAGSVSDGVAVGGTIDLSEDTGLSDEAEAPVPDYNGENKAEAPVEEGDAVTPDFPDLDSKVANIIAASVGSGPVELDPTDLDDGEV